MVGCCDLGTKDCVFCDVTRNNGFNIVYEDNEVIAFHDRSPASKLHLLIIPRQHVGTVKDLKPEHRPLLSKMAEVGKHLSMEHNQVRMGFHVPPFNSVNHLHLHVLSLPFKNLWRKLKYQPSMPWFAPVNDVMTHLGA
ncbi:hypothetical protein K450DRAFT_224182 [Umbelopsis ramanniana AG]|uniref:HIT domain-containing protein n=1 Tax=Umbelopsis ramanniana AG TaxID=1314678 RepID=A0AAD5EHN1_UMBRA|nr:uncharacterized protein K450DRAFT_224182 [Umbelopsis ramanniana AG]KAI8583091.1 hypothetical protein K450DRAFT_224182 [Umbelopsis ramanniana AG]